jgi:hypothetical protein
MGIAMGRNPNGAVRDIARRYGSLNLVPAAMVGLAVTLTVTSSLAVAGAITGWGLVFAGAAALVLWPQVADLVVARRTAAAASDEPEPLLDLEWAGIDRPLTDAELREIDARLGLEEVPA